MARKFAEISFTPSVKAAQTRYGSRAANEGFELAEDPRNALGDAEAEFIEARDAEMHLPNNLDGPALAQNRGGFRDRAKLFVIIHPEYFPLRTARLRLSTEIVVDRYMKCTTAGRYQFLGFSSQVHQSQ